MKLLFPPFTRLAGKRKAPRWKPRGQSSFQMMPRLCKLEFVGCTASSVAEVDKTGQFHDNVLSINERCIVTV